MATNKFHGVVGFVISEETTSGYFSKNTVEKPYYGDVKWVNQKYDQSNTMNGNIRINNSIEIVANQFAFDNFAFIEYVVWKGKKWTVSNVELMPHRLALTIGELYNG